jgi:hypothetical protein
LFKAYCARKGTTMKDEIQGFMERVTRNQADALLDYIDEKENGE